MVLPEIVVVGAGGFGRETLDVIDAVNARAATWRIRGVADDAPAQVQVDRLASRGHRVLGSVAEVAAAESGWFVVGIGNPTTRSRVAQTFAAAGWKPATVVHPTAVLGSRTVLAEGTVVCGGVQLSTNVVLGRHVHVNPGAVIGHDTVLEDLVSVNPGAVVSGEVHVGARALLGAGSVVLQGLEIGEAAVVGAGACVTRSVPAGTTVVGVPARTVDDGRQR